MFVPFGVFTGAQEYFISNWRGVPPGVPPGTNTKGTSPQGHFCASSNGTRRAPTSTCAGGLGTPGKTRVYVFMFRHIQTDISKYHFHNRCLTARRTQLINHSLFSCSECRRAKPLVRVFSRHVFSRHVFSRHVWFPATSLFRDRLRGGGGRFDSICGNTSIRVA